MSRYFGIDPGLTGSIVVIDGSEFVEQVRYEKLPTGAFTKNIVNIDLLNADIAGLVEKHEISTAVIEEPLWFSGPKGSGAVANQFYTYGATVGILIAEGVRVKVVKPTEWNKFFNLYGKKKKESIQCAAQLDPHFKGMRVKDADIAEAFLIGVYGNLKKAT